MRDVRSMLQSHAAKRGRPFMLAARVPDSVQGCHTDGLDIETWAREGLVHVLIVGTRTIHVDVDSFRKAMAGANVKLMPSFDCLYVTDGYHGDQSLDLVCGFFGNYLHQGAADAGAFNGIIGSPEQAKKFGLTQTDTRDLQGLLHHWQPYDDERQGEVLPARPARRLCSQRRARFVQQGRALAHRTEERSSTLHPHTSHLGASEIRHRSAFATGFVSAHRK